MNKRIIISVLLGTILLFIWNAVSWMALPFHSNTLNNIPEEVIDGENMKNLMIKDGVYHYPGLPAQNTPEELQKIESKLKDGPRITMMVYKRGATDFFDPKLFIGGLLINFITVLFTIYLISKLKLSDLKSVVLACLAIGVIISLVSDVQQMNWYLFPLDYTLVNVTDRLVSFGLLGLLFGIYTFKNKENV